MPENTVYVGRPTRWGNPWKVNDPLCPFVQTAQECVDAFRRQCASMPSWQTAAQRELRGKNLACWCALDQPCHADVLLEIANEQGDHKLSDLAAAARGVIDAMFSTYKAKNGREVGIEDKSGEKCWIVPFDAMFELETALPNFTWRVWPPPSAMPPPDA